MRTVVNVKAGGQTPISGAFHATILLIIILGAGVLATNIPKAVLAGILIKVGTDIIDWNYLKRLKTAPKAGVIIMLTVFFITVLIDLITAVAIGVIMASFLFMQRMVNFQLENMKLVTAQSEELPLSDLETQVLEQANDRILLYHLGGPLSFGAAKGMVRRLASFDQYDLLVLDFTDVPMIDFTSARAVEDMIVDAQKRGRKVYTVARNQKVMTFLQKQGVLKHLPPEHQYDNRLDALQSALKAIQDTEIARYKGTENLN